MDGQWYDINYQDGLGLLFLAGVVLLVAIVVQILSHRLKWYPPIIVAVVAYTPAIVELARWGSGDCGMVFFSRAQFSVFATALFLAYESFRLYQRHSLLDEYARTRAKIEEFENRALRKRDAGDS